MAATARRRSAKSKEAPAGDEPLTDTQRRILTAALEIFSEKGFSGSSTAEIAARAEVAEKTLFAQFKTKGELLARTLRPSVFVLIEPRVLDRVRDAVAPAGKTLADVLRALMRDRIELASSHPKKLKLVAHELLLRPEFFKTFSGTFRERIQPYVMEAFADLVARGEIRTDLPPRTLVRTFVSITFGYAIARYVLGLEEGGDDDAEIERIVDLLVHGLKPR